MWEESPDGGIWITKIRKEDDIDSMWEALLLALIGEQFGESNVIGISLSLRTKEKLIQVWLKEAKDQKMKQVVSNKMRHFLKLDPDLTTLYFKEHKASMKDQSTMKNALGYKFEKKNKEASESAKDNFEKSDRFEKSGSFHSNKRRNNPDLKDGSSSYNSFSNQNNSRGGWKPNRNSMVYQQQSNGNFYSGGGKNQYATKQNSYRARRERDSASLLQN